MERRCLWLSEVDAEPCAPLSGSVDADVCVVGGGYTGLWTALRVLELAPSASVVLVEASVCGAGASGRNGGFALSWWSKLPSLIARCGRAEAVRLAEASTAALEELEGFERGGWLWSATSAAQLGAWEDAVAAGAPFEPLAADEIRSRTGSPVHLGGVLDPAAGTVQPARLVAALRQRALECGVQLYEGTPMVSLDRGAGVVRCPGGASVRAGAIVLATNARLAGVPELHRALAVVSSDVVATAPMPDALAAAGWMGGEAISDSRQMVRYLRTTADGRVVLGRGGGALGFGARFDFDDPPAARTRAVADELPTLVPAARGVPIEYAWGGAVDRSVDGLPFFGRLPGRARVVYGAGFSGNGVGPCVVGGRILASMALGRSDEWSGCGLARGVPSARFPPEPIRYLGGALVRRAVGRKERLETAGGRAGPVTRAFASLAPKGR
jgi:glycine/D-amino acid oxidase-like deaminating enzyme